MISPYILADDLSGALEAGASFRARGFDVSVPLSEHADPDALQVVTTETRNLRPVEAANVVRAALQRQHAAGHRLVFKKIDSTLRGPLAAEISALFEVLNPSLVIFCPANPATGRTVVDGVLRVKGVPLTETEFRQDPIWPAQSSRIRELLEIPSVTVGSLSLAMLRSTRARQYIATARRDGTRLLVSDAATQEDLVRLVAAARYTSVETIFVGANGLADAVARSETPADARAAEKLPAISSWLVTCGSRHPASHRQIEQLESAGRARVLTVAPDDISPAEVSRRLVAEFSTHPAVALRFDPAVAADAAQLVQAIAAILAPFSQGAGPDAYFFTGGETAWAACRTLGGQSLQILATWEHTVVVSRLSRTGLPPAYIFTKPGGYGDDSMLLRLQSEVMK